MRMAPSYENFDVLLERSSQGLYKARVVQGPAGQGARVAFAQPFGPLEVENFLLPIGRPRRPVRRVDAPETEAIKDFGQRLYGALFHDDLRVSLERSLSEAAAKDAGLRLRLRLSDTPELAELPWEFLYDRVRTDRPSCAHQVRGSGTAGRPHLFSHTIRRRRRPTCRVPH